jgi:hypothetical protein
MDTDHLSLKSLEVILQTHQLVLSFVICSNSLIDHAEGANDELQSESNETHHASRQAEWVHLAFEGAIGVEEFGQCRRLAC